MASAGLVQLSWLILERGRLGAFELADFGKSRLGTVELADFRKGRLGTVELADFGKGRFGTVELADFGKGRLILERVSSFTVELADSARAGLVPLSGLILDG